MSENPYSLTIDTNTSSDDNGPHVVTPHDADTPQAPARSESSSDTSSVSTSDPPQAPRDFSRFEELYAQREARRRAEHQRRIARIRQHRSRKFSPDDDDVFDSKPKKMDEEKLTLEDYLPVDFKLPVQTGSVSPSLWLDTKKKMIGALTKVPHSDPTIPSGGGFAHIMLTDTDEYRTLVGNHAVNIPPAPTVGPRPSITDAVAARRAAIGAGEANPMVTITHDYKSWLNEVKYKQEYDQACLLVRNFLDDKFPSHCKRHHNKYGVLPTSLSVPDLMSRLNTVIMNSSAVDKEVALLEGKLKKTTFSHDDGGDAFFVDMLAIREALSDLENPATVAAFLTDCRNAIRKAPAFKTNTMNTMLNEVKAVETVFRVTNPRGSDDDVIERFATSVVRRVKELIPDGDNRNRANYVTMTELNDALGNIQGDIEALEDNQQTSSPSPGHTGPTSLLGRQDGGSHRGRLEETPQRNPTPMHPSQERQERG